MWCGVVWWVWCGAVLGWRGVGYCQGSSLCLDGPLPAISQPIGWWLAVYFGGVYRIGDARLVVVPNAFPAVAAAEEQCIALSWSDHCRNSDGTGSPEFVISVLFDILGCATVCI